MKISYIVPCVGACTLLMFSSCRSTDADGYSESALPMSEIADGEIPPWLLEDDGSNGKQIGAGSHTPTPVASRNDYSIPEPTETSSGTRQNQPKFDAAGHDDAMVETVSQAGVDPMAATQPYVDETPVATTTTVKPKTGGTKKTGSTSKPKKPTMIVYKVRPGDSLSLIAARSNTTVEQIRRDSNIKGTTIYPGQTIKVRYTPKGYKAPAKSTKTSSASGKTHTVTAGQTLSGIAARYGVSTSQLMKANGLTAADAKKIRPGQKLKVPAKR